MDAFLQDNMNETLTKAEEVISNEPKTSEYKTEALYLCAQAHYRLRQYPQTVEAIDTYQQQNNVAQSNNQKTAKKLIDGLANQSKDIEKIKRSSD